MKFSEKMLSSIEKYDMLENGSRVTVALSGGADSVSLLLGLTELKEKLDLKITAAHVNHMLRGEDSEKDMEFVRLLCEKLGIKLYIRKENIAEYAKKHKCSKEDAGRQVRYKFFEEVSSAEKSRIATAHTKNDNSENFFISALRGTRITGIPPVRGNIIRPLIEITKSEIYDYIKENNQDFCVDKSNFSEDYFRNKVRLKLIPYIESEFETDVAECLSSNLDVMYEENDFLASLVKEFMKKNCVFEKNSVYTEIQVLNSCHKALKRRIIRELYYSVSCGGYISQLHTDNVIRLCETGITGKCLTLCGNVTAEISYGKLIVKLKTKTEDYLYKLKKEDFTEITETGVKIRLSENLEKSENLDKRIPYFCSDDTEFTVRNRRNGDKIYIKGVGHKKLSDFFTDRKIPRNLRDEIPVITDSDGICAVGDIYLRKEDAKYKIYVYII